MYDDVGAFLTGPYIILMGGGIIALLITAVVFGVQNAIADKEAAKEAAEAKAYCETKIAVDSNLREFDMNSFEMSADDNGSFFSFTGNAIKSDGLPLNFVSVKYKVSMTNCLDLQNYILSNNMTSLEQYSTEVFKRIYNILLESEIVSTGGVEQINAKITDTSDGKISMIRSISNPIVNKENGTVEYYAEIMTTNLNKTENAEIKFETKKVSVPLTKELEAHPTGIFLLDKDNCKVEKLNEEIVSIANNEVLCLTDNFADEMQ